MDNPSPPPKPNASQPASLWTPPPANASATANANKGHANLNRGNQRLPKAPRGPHEPAHPTKPSNTPKGVDKDLANLDIIVVQIREDGCMVAQSGRTEAVVVVARLNREVGGDEEMVEAV